MGSILVRVPQKLWGLAVNWRPSEVGGELQSKSEGLGTRETDGINPSLGLEDGAREGEMRCLSSYIEAGKRKLLLPSPFVVFGPAMD